MVRERFMRRRQFTAALAAPAFGGGLAAAVAPPAWALGEADAAAGVRAALERGALAAVALLGRTDGFLGNPQVRIPLPGALADAEKLLRATGQGRQLDELVTSMNRAAEAAVPQAKALFVGAVKSISIEDALRIVRGGATSVTEFFATKTRTPLGERFLPIVMRATERVSLAQRYNTLAQRAAGLGLLEGDAVSVQQHVTTRALDGLYLMIGEEERKIRANPAATGSAILRRVFGS
jgi:hypothetical protein